MRENDRKMQQEEPIMKFHIDTANVDEIRKANDKGIPTNCTLIFSANQALLAGADIATVPYKVIEQMLHHPLTDAGIEKFKADYTKVFGA